MDRPYLLDVSRLVWRRWAGRLPTGIDRVCLAYLEHYGPRSRAVIQGKGARRVLNARTSDKLFRMLLAGPPGFRRDVTRTFIAEALRRPGRSVRDRIYLNVGHTGLDDPRFLRWVRQSGVRPVYMVHDLIPITHPEYCRAGEAERHRARIRTMLRSAAGVIGNSEATLDALSTFAAEEGLEVPQSVAAWLGTTVPAPPPARAEQSTFVVLGTIEARKNHLMLLQLWSRLIQRLGDDAPRLLVIGQRGWECEQVFDLLDRSPVLPKAVVEIGRSSDSELAAHLASARALLFPSLVEGYGLPLVEALAAGTPVIASDLPVFREIGQGLPDFIDPLDAPAWEAAILDYASSSGEARKRQIERIKDYRAPTWEGHFRTVDDWLSSL